MTTPLAFYFCAQFKYIPEPFLVELGILFESTGTGHAEFVCPGCDLRSEFVFLYHDFQYLFLIRRVHHPALRFNVGCEIFHHGLAMLIRPLTAREVPSRLICSEKIRDRTQAHQSRTLAREGSGCTEH